MLSYYSLPEALRELEKQTGRAWTDSELFNAALRAGAVLHAAPPRGATVTAWEFVIGEGMVAKQKGLGWCMAILHPAAVAELWQAGETDTIHAVGDTMQNQYRWFDERVIVTRENTRVSGNALARIAKSPPVREQASSAASAPDSPLGTRERNTLLCIIAALCSEAKIDYNKAAKAAGAIVNAAASLGLDVGESTIEAHLKKIPQAIESRSR